jgi:polysaccharide export outer membrane protein
MVIASMAHGQGQFPLGASQKSVSRSDGPSLEKPGYQKEYTVGVDDILDINVIKPMQIANSVTVAPDGAITFPFIGNLQVKGMSLAEIQEEIQKRLADGYMEYPIVSVSLRQIRSKKFTISGQVARPGSYPVEENMTLLSAITVAGGFIEARTAGKVKLLRPTDQEDDFDVIIRDITDLLSGKGRDVKVLPQDTIVVTVDKFYISGQVARPGSYRVEERMTILQAITAAGGFIQTKATGIIKLLRLTDRENVTKLIEMDITDVLQGKHQAVHIQAEDTIVVSQNNFFVYGEVARPGKYTLETNTTALTALSMAGGIVGAGTTGKIKIYRAFPAEKEAVMEISLAEVLKGQAKDVLINPDDTMVISADKFYVTGEVTQPGAYAVKMDMSLINAITAAGGFRNQVSGNVRLLRQNEDQEKFVVLDAKLDKVLKGEFQEVRVLPNDTIVVAANKFYIYGEVNRPGMYPLEEGTTVLTAISIAGGFTKFGSANRVKILRMDEGLGWYESIDVNINEVISGYAPSDALLQPGDIVVASEGMF